MIIQGKHHPFINPNNWANHLPLLLLALEKTKTSPHPILQLGGRDDTAPVLRDYCLDAGRRTVIVEEDILKCSSYRNLADVKHVDIRCASFEDGDHAREKWSVVLISSQPGERQKRDAARFADTSEIVVLHNTEPAADYGYKFSEIWHRFRSRVDIKTEGAWSSAASNTHDLSIWRGTRLGPYIVSGSEDDVKIDKTAETLKDFQAGRNVL